MRSKLIPLLILATLLVASMSTLAASTAEQEQLLVDARAKVVAAQKALITAQVEAGILTQEQADKVIAQLDARLEKNQPIGEEQKQALAAAHQEHVVALKELVSAQVAAGQITPERGEYLTKLIEARAQYQEAIGYERAQLGQGFGRQQNGPQAGVRQRQQSQQRQALPNMQGRMHMAPGLPGQLRQNNSNRLGIRGWFPGAWFQNQVEGERKQQGPGPQNMLPRNK